MARASTPPTFVIAFMLHINYIMDTQTHFYNNKHAHWVVMKNQLSRSKSIGVGTNGKVPLEIQCVKSHH